MRLAIVIVLAGCWTGSEASVEEPSEPVVVSDARQPSPYRAIAGTWRGIGLQYDTQEQWEVVMILRAHAALGSPIGTIEYPTLQCKAELILEGQKAGKLVLREKMIIGAGTCIDGGTIRIPRDGQTPLDWRWFDPSGSEGAKAQLER